MLLNLGDIVIILYGEYAGKLGGVFAIQRNPDLYGVVVNNPYYTYKHLWLKPSSIRLASITDCTCKGANKVCSVTPHILTQKDIHKFYITKKQQNTKVIFNNPATILFYKGRKYVSIVQRGDKFSKEKGLLMCIAKANGFEYSDIKKLIDTAETFSPNKENK